MAIRHVFNSEVADDPNATIIRPSDWNAEHTVSGPILTPSIDTQTAAPLIIGGTNATGINIDVPVDAASIICDAIGVLAGNASGGVDSTTSATSIVLNSSNKLVQYINMTVAGLTVTLPDATVLRTGISYVFYAINNPYTVIDSNGNRLAYIEQPYMPSGTATVSSVTGYTTPRIGTSLYLVDNSTVAGIWTASTQQTVSNLLTSHQYNQSAYPTDIISSVVVSIDATRFMSAYIVGGSIQLISGSYTAKINDVDATNVAIVVLSSARALCIYNTSNGYINATVLIIDSTSITIGDSAIVVAYTTGYINAASLTDTKVICTYSGNNEYLEAVVIDITGDVISGGTPLIVNSIQSRYVAVATISDTDAVCAYQGTNGYLDTIVLTVSGTVVSPGTVVNINSTASTYISISRINASKLICAYRSGTGYVESLVLSVAGGNISAGAIVTLSALTRCYTAVVAVSDTVAVLAYVNEQQLLYVASVSIADTTLLIGAPSAVGAELTYSVCIATHGTNVAIACVKIGASTDTSYVGRYYAYVANISIYYGVLNPSALTILDTTATVNSGGNNMCLVKLTSTKFIAIYNRRNASLCACVVDKSGNTFTYGITYVLTATNIGNYITAFRISDTTAVCIYQDNDLLTYARTITVSGTVISAGTIFQFTGPMYHLDACVLDQDAMTILVSYITYGNYPYVLCGVLTVNYPTVASFDKVSQLTIDGDFSEIVSMRIGSINTTSSIMLISAYNLDYSLQSLYLYTLTVGPSSVDVTYKCTLITSASGGFFASACNFAFISPTQTLLVFYGNDGITGNGILASLIDINNGVITPGQVTQIVASAGVLDLYYAPSLCVLNATNVACCFTVSGIIHSAKITINGSSVTTTGAIPIAAVTHANVVPGIAAASATQAICLFSTQSDSYYKSTVSLLTDGVSLVQAYPSIYNTQQHNIKELKWIDSTRALLLYTTYNTGVLLSGFYAKVVHVNNNTVEYGKGNVLRVGTVGGAVLSSIALLRLDENRFRAFYVDTSIGDSYSNIYYSIITIDNDDVTISAPTVLCNASTETILCYLYNVSIANFDDTHILLSSSDSYRYIPGVGGTYGNVVFLITFDGDFATSSTASFLPTWSSSGINQRVTTRIDTNKILCVTYQYLSVQSVMQYVVQATVISLYGGNILAMQPPTTLLASTSSTTFGYLTALANIDGTHALLVGSASLGGSYNIPYAYIITISGNDISMGAAINISGTSTAQGSTLTSMSAVQNGYMYYSAFFQNQSGYVQGMPLIMKTNVSNVTASVSYGQQLGVGSGYSSQMRMDVNNSKALCVYTDAIVGLHGVIVEQPDVT